MQAYSLFRRLTVLTIIFLYTYIIADSIHCHSYWGIALSIASLIALICCMQLIKKLKQVKQAEE